MNIFEEVDKKMAYREEKQRIAEELGYDSISKCYLGLALKGHRQTKIAKIFDVAPLTISTTLNKVMPNRPKKHGGNRSYAPKWVVEEIRRSTLTYEELAVKYDMTKTNVRYIKTGRTWKNI